MKSLTEIHVLSLQANEITVVLGVHDRLTMDNGRAWLYNVSQVIVHPDHYEEPKGFYDVNDVALLKLSKEIAFHDSVKPICLPDIGKLYFFNII